MAEIKLTHLQRRRLVQLERIANREFGLPITSHWNSSRAANEKLCELGLVERCNQCWHYPSGKVCSVGDARITDAGKAWLLADRLDRPTALTTPDTGRK